MYTKGYFAWVEQAVREVDHPLHRGPRLRMNGAVSLPPTCLNGVDRSYFTLSSVMIYHTDRNVLNCCLIDAQLWRTEITPKI
jgi:hypothetical protein